ncbi:MULTISPECIES: oxygen-independent coproporphyrinogen III oxidase [unclassified Pantoea]|uniref:oxygen-independent coproporphyrinogen III oxidase n=1 Tax=unclassified Pantoea TaxID=2630326 RepID=UPI0012321BCA|nr:MULTISPECIES: oxygen-independent coproporphyrinogen III oxidase [unclassified Pantoea]KAA5966619.1 oxygen-independent coproporphyrinogen III oxidase [Pantoea sp. M_6]KAA5973291.1 oxygen-independent coproporphyrinogen III oxidase [Pantoea sp. M_8]KAA5986736.1 oxygen-independent coproporphyrinogen III oxidase [Pantoea sp. M_10]KAA5992834.1 oxygen-independent coproporphyrinogen III oxidase [Pantoea sp. M_5]
MPSLQIAWDQALIEKYNYAGPRYTSYPTALEFSEDYTETDFQHAVARYPGRPLSLYVHIPFCHRLCYFCGCNKQVTRQRHKADRYLDVLEEEIIQRAPLFRQRRVTQLHWGGGTPTFLDRQQVSRLVGLLKQHFNVTDDAEMSIEVDPREMAPDMIDHLRSLGFNRLSMGVQDFNKAVQARVNRVQDEEVIFSLMARAREQGFRSTSIDLIYGLPLQTPDSFAWTLERVVALNPDRLSVFNYAHLPALFAAQRKIKEDELPSARQKLDILQQTIATLTQQGYHYIGMDHFAKPQDELAVAQRDGKLHRNFQGYTTQGDSDLLGLGVSAISMVGDSYAQNQKDLNSWYSSVEQQGNGLWRGVALTRDDCLRRDVIKTLICHFSLDFSATEAQWGICFHDYFAEDLALLKPLIADGLVEQTTTGLEVTGIGRLLVRNICMCFDRYLRQKVRQQQFSRVI